MKDDLLEKIKSRGFWRISFQPIVAIQKFSSLSECKEIVEKNAVKQRGWDYPAIPRGSRDYMGIEPAENYYCGWTDWMNYKEFWRMYQSGQFLHYLALGEDWFGEDEWHKELAQKIKPMSSLNIIGSVVYQITEIFEFLSRLTNSGMYDEGVYVSISLNNTKNRELWISDPMRASFLRPYKTVAAKIEFTKKYSREQINESPKNNALEAMRYFFERFGWENLPIETLKKDQDNFLAGKFF